MELLEYITLQIADKCHIEVPYSKVEKYSDYGHTLLLKRFDRDGSKRIHYISGVNALMTTDGSSSDFTYLDIIEFIKINSFDPQSQLRELYKRIVFNYLINNTDNHLRNHAFVLDGRFYKLSPAFDINPNLFESYFELNVLYGTNKEQILLVSQYCMIDSNEASQIYMEIYETIKTELENYKAKYKDLSKEISTLLKIVESRQ